MDQKFFQVREEPRLLPVWAESIRFRQMMLPGFEESPFVYVKGNGRSNGNGHHTVPGQLTLWSEEENNTLLGMGQTGQVVPLYPEAERTLRGVGVSPIEEFDDGETPIVDNPELHYWQEQEDRRRHRPTIEGTGFIGAKAEEYYHEGISSELAEAFVQALENEAARAKSPQLKGVQVENSDDQSGVHEQSVLTKSMSILVSSGSAGMEDIPQEDIFSQAEKTPPRHNRFRNPTSESMIRNLADLREISERVIHSPVDEHILNSQEEPVDRKGEITQERIDFWLEQASARLDPKIHITADQNLQASAVSGDIENSKEDTLEIKAEKEFRQSLKPSFFGRLGKRVVQTALAAGVAAMAYLGITSLPNQPQEQLRSTGAVVEQKAAVVKPTLAVFNSQQKAGVYAAHLTQSDRPEKDGLRDDPELIPPSLMAEAKRKKIYTSLVNDFSQGIGKSNSNRYNLADGLTHQNVINIILKRWFKNKDAYLSYNNAAQYAQAELGIDLPGLTKNREEVFTAKKIDYSDSLKQEIQDEAKRLWVKRQDDKKKAGEGTAVSYDATKVATAVARADILGTHKAKIFDLSMRQKEAPAETAELDKLKGELNEIGREAVSIDSKIEDIQKNVYQQFGEVNGLEIDLNKTGKELDQAEQKLNGLENKLKELKQKDDRTLRYMDQKNSPAEPQSYLDSLFREAEEDNISIIKRMQSYHSGSISSGTVTASEPSVIVDRSYLAEIDKQQPKVEINADYQKELSSWDEIDNGWDEIFSGAVDIPENKVIVSADYQKELDTALPSVIVDGSYQQDLKRMEQPKVEINADYLAELELPACKKAA